MDNFQQQSVDFIVINIDNNYQSNNQLSKRYIDINDLEANKYVNTLKRSFIARLFN